MNTSTRTQRSAMYKTIALVLAVIVAFTAIGYGVHSTFAAADDVPVTLTAPGGIGASNTIEVAATKSETIFNLSDAVSGDTSLATVGFTAGTSAGNLRITGVKAGIVTISNGTNVGIIQTTRYQITDSRNVSAYTLHNNGEAIFESSDKPAMAAPVTFNVSNPNVSWSTTNSTVATVNPNSGLITPVDDGAAIILGKFVDKWGRDQVAHILVVVGNHGGGGNGGGTVITGPDGNKYKPLARPPHVFEVLDEDGNSLEPPEYVYNPGDNPGDGNDVPAIPDGNGNFYIEEPENIWTPINNGDGSLEEDNKFWGGPDGKPDGGPNGGDNKPVGIFENGDGDDEYWVHMGQNVWREYSGSNPKGPLGPLTGGGPDGDPTTDPVTEIFDNTTNDGKYYVGPLGPDEDGNIYYWGDPATGGNGTLDSTANGAELDDVKFYKDENGTMSTTKPPKPITEVPTGTDDGRTLTPDDTGDTVNWIEIARNGDYSLIIRTDFINIAENHFGEASWQGDTFGSSIDYQGSNPQTRINDWFNGRPAAVESLSAEARLRNFTVSNNASVVLGTGSSDEGGLTNGFSKPTIYQTGSGNDVAFILSFAEAANFISKEYNVTPGGGNAPSSPLAASNFERLNPYSPAISLWLRSPGTNASTATELQHGIGRVFQLNRGSATALIYPALWVHSSIFD